MEKKRIIVLGHEVEIRLNEKRREDAGIARTFLEGDDGELFVMEYFGTVTVETVVHECWHCIFRILYRCDKEPHSFAELMEEIYAYVFSDFVHETMNTLQSMKTYKRIYATFMEENDDSDKRDK